MQLGVNDPSVVKRSGISSHGRPVRRIASVLAGNVLFGTGLIFHAFLYNFYLESLHLSAEVMGHAAAALAAGGVITLLPAGGFFDRAGAKAALVTAATVLAVGLALGALATTPLALYVAALVAGVGSGIWRVTTPPVLMALTDSRSRARVFAWNVGLLVSWGSLVTALAGVLSHWLEARWGLERLTALRAALLIGAAASATSPLLFVTLPRSLSAPRASTTQSTEAPPARGLARTMLPRIALVALWMLGAALTAPFFNIFFTRAHRLSIQASGAVVAAGNIAGALAALAGGELTNRFGMRRVLVASMLCFAPAAWGISLAGTLRIAVILYLLQGAVGPVTNPLIDQWLLGLTPPERQGVVSSWRQMAADASAIVGASVGGVLLAAGAFGPLFIAAGAVGLAGAVALFVSLRRTAPLPRFL